MSKYIKTLWFKYINSYSYDYDKFCKLLSKNSIDVNITDKHNFTALMLACRDEQIDVVKLLLEQPGININYQGYVETTALIIATKNRRLEISKLLLSRPEIDITLKEDNNMNFMGYIIMYNIDTSFLKDYNLQKTIIKNGRKDIIEFLDKYDLALYGILENSEDFIDAYEWGLLS